MRCPECEEILDYLDIVERSTGIRISFDLYICHNEDCVGYGQVYCDRLGELIRGGPTGCY